MSDPCIQEGRVKTLESALGAISESLSDLRETAKDTYRVLADISKQGAELQALSIRVDRTERMLDQLVDHLRIIEEKLITHSTFISQHEKTERDGVALRNPVISGLILAAIIAATTLLFWMVDKHQYTQRSSGVSVQQPVGGKQ